MAAPAVDPTPIITSLISIGGGLLLAWYARRNNKKTEEKVSNVTTSLNNIQAAFGPQAESVELFVKQQQAWYKEIERLNTELDNERSMREALEIKLQTEREVFRGQIKQLRDKCDELEKQLNTKLAT